MVWCAPGWRPITRTPRRVTRLFDRVSRHRHFRFYLNVEIGKHLSHAELLAHHHAVLYAVGAPDDRRLDIDGMGLPGTATATELVAWINGHPEFANLPVDLSHERVVVVGNGNVALDVARVLTADPNELARTDISDHALEVLRGSAVREVVIAARRGPAHSAFTLPELIGLTSTRDVVLDADDHKLVESDLATVSDGLTRSKLEILSKLGDASVPAPRIRLAYQLTPKRVLGRQRVTGVEFSVTGTEEVRRLDAGLVLTSIGYRGKPIRDLPFDESAAVVPNEGGRVVPGAYVAGLDQAGTDRLHRHQQVVLFADRPGPGRRLQRRQADRPGGQAGGADQAGARSPARRRRLGGMACHRRRRDYARHRRAPAAQQVHRCRRHARGRGHRAGAAAAAPAGGPVAVRTIRRPLGDLQMRYRRRYHIPQSPIGQSRSTSQRPTSPPGPLRR